MVQYPAGAREFSLLQSTPTGYRAHPASSSMGNTAHDSGIMQLQQEADHSCPLTAQVHMACCYASAHLNAFMLCCLINHKQCHLYVCQSSWPIALHIFQDISIWVHGAVTNATWVILIDLQQRCTNPRHQVTQTTEVHVAASNIHRSSESNLHHVNFSINKILRWLLGFWKICEPLTLQPCRPETNHLPWQLTLLTTVVLLFHHPAL